MMHQWLFRNSIISVAVAASIGLTACGGGGDSADTTTTTTDTVIASTLSGTAAAGAAIIGQVTVKGSLGNTKSALIEANGNYTVDVTGLTAPYRLRAEGTVGGRTYRLHSYAEAADIGGNVNITPFTDLIVANAASQIAESYFDSSTPADLDPAEIDAQEAALQAKLQDVFSALGVDSAIDLLNSTFSADHSGLDAALDIVRVEVDAGTNLATITNLVEGTTIQDSVTDLTDNTDTLLVNNAATLTTSMTDTQLIAAKFDALSATFANGLPSQTAIQDYFSTDFYDEDTPKGLWLTDITTDPNVIGLTFAGIVVSSLDSTAGTATVTFNYGTNGVMSPEPATWYVVKDATLGWQMRGDQRIVETYFSYHCNDYDGTGSWAGSCGINTRFWDNDFTNNGTGGAAIASGTVKIINSSSVVKATVYLGTPAGSAPGDVQVYSESDGQYYGDWKGFGTGVGEIDSSIFAVGDTIQYALYTQVLDTSVQASPAIAAGAVAVATYTDTVLFVPDTVLTKIPSATSATLTAMSNFTLGNNLTVAWTLAAGTRNNEILVEVSDSMGNRIEIWADTFGTTATSKTFASSLLDSAAATAAGLDSTAATYNLKVRGYAEDELTGQQYSRDYDVTIPGPAAGGGGGGSSLVCGYESGWDDTADAGLGAPITPNSLADYESVIQDCLGGVASTFTAADISGTSYVDTGETSTFNTLGAATGSESDRGTGIHDDGTGVTTNFEWWVENASCVGCNHSYVVVYTDPTIEAGLPAGFWFRETTAITAVSGTTYTMYRYAEQENYSDTDRATGSDGEIWYSPSNVLQ